MWKRTCSPAWQVIPSICSPVVSERMRPSAGPAGIGTPSGPSGPAGAAGWRCPTVESRECGGAAAAPPCLIRARIAVAVKAAIPAATPSVARGPRRRPLTSGRLALFGLGRGSDRARLGGSLEERLDQVDRCREDDRRRVGAADLEQRLQVAELECDRVLLDHERRVLELLRRLELALGVDDLRAPLALGFGLAGHRALHLRGDLDVLDLDDRDLDPPGAGLLVDDRLQDRVDLLAFGEQLVQGVLPEHGAQGGLGDL